MYTSLLIVIVSGVAEGDVSGSFVLKEKGYSRADDRGRNLKAAKYSIALQYLVYDGIVKDEVE